jgi:hypothetical protein
MVKSGVGQIEVTVHGAPARAIVHHQPYRLCLELVFEPPPRAAPLRLCHRSGLRIRPSEDVDRLGSSPGAALDLVAVLIDVQLGQTFHGHGAAFPNKRFEDTAKLAKVIRAR